MTYKPILITAEHNWYVLRSKKHYAGETSCEYIIMFCTASSIQVYPSVSKCIHEGTYRPHSCLAAVCTVI